MTPILNAAFRRLILAMPIWQAAILLYADTPEACKIAAWWEAGV